MISLPSWFTPDTIRALGWTLVHFVWQGAALALLLYVATVFSRKALVRYSAAVCTLVLMTLCPVFTFLVIEHQSEPATFQPSAITQTLHAFEALASPTVAVPAQTALSLASIDWLTCFVCLWFAGVLMFGVRALGGWLLLERLHREKTEPLAVQVRERCIRLQQRLGLSRTVGYSQSRLIDSPAVVGWFRPVVLLPVTALTGLSAEQLEAIIVHELAHVKRYDCFVNLFQVAVETVLFYHPAVWWVSRTIRIERENCCDDVAVGVCGNVGDYARALTEMESWRATPAMVVAANGGSLKSRISRLLGLQTMTHSVSRGGLAAIGVLFAAGALLASTTFNRTVSHMSDFDSIPPQAVEQSAAPSLAAAPVASAASVAPSRPVPRAPVPNSTPAAIADTAADPSAPEPPQTPAPPSANGSYIDSMQAAGLKNITVDDLIALKIQGVTPEYIKEIRATGLDPTVRDLIGLKVQGVTAAYVSEMRETGLNPSVHDLISMRVQGVTADYVRKVRSGGWSNATVHDIISMRVQGVDPADAGQYQQLGLKNLTLHDLIGLKVQGVTPEYIRAMQAAGFTNLSTHEYISAKVQGITPEFIQKVHSHGFDHLTLRQLLELKRADVF